MQGPTTGYIDNTGGGGEGGGGGGGGGLDQAAVLALINTSSAGPQAPSSVTSSGAMKSASAFSFDVDNAQKESELAKAVNGGLVLRKGVVNYLSCSPFSGCTFGVNTTCWSHARSISRSMARYLRTALADTTAVQPSMTCFRNGSQLSRQGASRSATSRIFRRHSMQGSRC